MGHIGINVRFLANLQKQTTLYLFISGIEINKSVQIYAEENLTIYIYIYIGKHPIHVSCSGPSASD
jgi:hypothetical protein